jgi:hypothetical protein
MPMWAYRHRDVSVPSQLHRLWYRRPIPQQLGDVGMASCRKKIGNATPLERLFLLLALNCGFNRAEIASLLIGETFIHQPHDALHQEMLHFQISPNDSFVKRVRRKSGIYGEDILFPQTVQGIHWAIANRRRDGRFGADDKLLLNDNGQLYDRPSKSGNAKEILGGVPNSGPQHLRCWERAAIQPSTR